MLAVYQRYFEQIRQAHSETDILAILANIASEFSVRSAYLIEYKPGMHGISRAIDTDAKRSRAWTGYFSNQLSVANSTRKALAAELPLFRLSVNRLAELDDRSRQFVLDHDMAEGVVLPLSYDGQIVGVMGLVGVPALDPAQEAVLPLIAYNLFAQMRVMTGIEPRHAPASLTNREKEVLRLSADGKTSQEIAVELGMSPRTVNQHVDNVADKLGTRNRAHTVAEVIRHGLLN